MRYLLKALLLFITSGTLHNCNQPEEEVQKPNIILIMTDDQGWLDVGFNGNDQIHTPNLDKLAKKGIILHRFYAASAVCSPTRASVITGRNPLRINIPHANTGHMKSEEITLPEILKDVGYATGHFGKWHLGTFTRDTLDANRGGREAFYDDYSIPSSHGYDTYFCTESKVPTFDPMVYPASFSESESKRYGWKAIESGEASKPYGTAYWIDENQKATSNLKGDDAQVIMDRVIPFIEASAKEEQPFFSTLWFHTPHLPVVADSIHRNPYENLPLDKQLYYGTITAMDEQVGRLWSKLKALGIEKNTMIWFCSDNGPEDNTPGSAGIFRGRKRSLHEGGLRTPAFVIWPSQLQGGTTLDCPMVTSDYLPTILDALNIDYPSQHPLDGESVLPIFLKKKSKREKPIGFIFQNQTSWVTTEFKLISKDNNNTFELYDLINDPSETNNIIEDKPNIAKNMKTALERWLTSVEKSSEGLDYQ